MTENSDASSKNLKSESKKINYDVVDASSLKISKWVEEVRRDRRLTLWGIICSYATASAKADPARSRIDPDQESRSESTDTFMVKFSWTDNHFLEMRTKMWRNVRCCNVEEYCKNKSLLRIQKPADDCHNLFYSVLPVQKYACDLSWRSDQ